MHFRQDDDKRYSRLEEEEHYYSQLDPEPVQEVDISVVRSIMTSKLQNQGKKAEEDSRCCPCCRDRAAKKVVAIVLAVLVTASLLGVGAFLVVKYGLDPQPDRGDHSSKIRPDGRCGLDYPLPDGRGPAQCAPRSGFHCCSRYGFCGNTPEHCNCEDCVDYERMTLGSLRCGPKHPLVGTGEAAKCNPYSAAPCCSADGLCGNSTLLHCACRGCVDYRKKPRGVIWTDENWAPACAFPSTSSRTLATKTSLPGELCGGACAATPDCSHFEWTRRDNGTCALRQGAVSRADAVRTEDDEGDVCGIVIRWETEGWALGCDFVGGGGAGRGEMMMGVAADKCGPRCRETAGCTHYSWRRRGADGGTCSLRRGAVGRGDAVVGEDKTMVCGIV